MLPAESEIEDKKPLKQAGNENLSITGLAENQQGREQASGDVCGSHTSRTPVVLQKMLLWQMKVS